MVNLAFLLFAAASPAYTIPATILPTHQVRVQVRVNDAGPFSCVFDTGGGVNLSLDLGTAERAGLHPSSHGTSSGAGAAIVEDARLPGVTLKLGDLGVPDRTVVMRSMTPGGCVFGTRILDKFVLQIDYIAGSIRLFLPGSFAAPAGVGSVPLTLENDHPNVAARIVLQRDDAIECRLTIDSALGPLPLVLAKRFTDEKQILTRVRKVVEPLFGASGTGGAVNLLATRVDRLSIGGASLAQPIAVLFRTAAGYQEADGLIGGDFLYRFLVTIDYPGRRLFLEPNRNFNDPPFAYDGSGMSIQPSDGGFFVASVVPATPAATAGFEKGDIVLAVDGESAAQLTRERIREKLLYRSSGTSVLIKIRRGDQELTYTIELKPLL